MFACRAEFDHKGVITAIVSCIKSARDPAGRFGGSRHQDVAFGVHGHGRGPIPVVTADVRAPVRARVDHWRPGRYREMNLEITAGCAVTRGNRRRLVPFAVQRIAGQVHQGVLAADKCERVVVLGQVVEGRAEPVRSRVVNDRRGSERTDRAADKNHAVDRNPVPVERLAEPRRVSQRPRFACAVLVN